MSARDWLLGTRARRAATGTLLSLAILLLAVELVCQLVAFVQLRTLAATREDPAHYYQPSSNELLAYELRRGYSTERDGRRLHINARGLREDSDERFASRQRIAILGDSVVFGTGLSQDRTLSALLQARVDPAGSGMRFLNAGVPGYGLGELPEWLRSIERDYAPQRVIYLLNPNDFVTRDTMYEGADNGLYRTYRQPWLKSPWVIRKLIYRLWKGGMSPTTRWYRWTYQGTKRENLAHLTELAEIAHAHGADFQVAFLPVRASFDAADPTLREIYAEIAQHLDAAGIPWVDPTEAFGAELMRRQIAVESAIDDTDHLGDAGNDVLVDVLTQELVLTASG